jgi:hypothetical protein
VAPDSSLKNDLMIDFMDWFRPGVNVPGTQVALWFLSGNLRGLI